MAITLIECGEEHLLEVRQFFARVYGADYVLARNEALLRWQFGGGSEHHTSRFHIKLAVMNGSVAACLGYIPVDVTVRGRPLRGAWTANWIVAPEHRHRALGPLLMRALVRQHDLTLVAGASAQAREILPRLGFNNFGLLRRYLYVTDPDAVATLTNHLAASWRSHWATGLTSAEHATEVRRTERFDSSVDDVWDMAWRDGAGTRRSAAFLNWRYADHPAFEYRLFQALTRGRVTGAAIYRIEAVRGLPIRVGRVVELVCTGSGPALLGAIVADARRENLALLDLFCSSIRVEPVLLQSGWLRADEAPADVPVLFQPVAADRRGIPFLAHIGHAASVPDIDGWYVTKGDGDQDRPN